MRLRGRAVLRAGLLAPCLLLALLCVRGCTAAGAPGEAAEPLWAGCSPTTHGCELGGDRTMTFWAERDGPLTVHVDVGPGDAEPSYQRVAGGFQTRVQIPAGARSLHVKNAVGERVLSLDLLDSPPVPTREEAERQWRDCGTPANHEPTACAIARGARARHLVRDPKQFDIGLAELAAAAEDKAAAGRIGDAASDEMALIHYFVAEKRSFQAARAALWRARRNGERVPKIVADTAYSEGVLAMAVGDVRTAFACFRASRLIAERLSMSKAQIAAMQMEADALVEIGRHEEATSIIAELRVMTQSMKDDCQRGDVLASLAWLGHELISRGSPAVGDPEAETLEALRVYGASCKVGSRVANALTNLAAISLARGDEGAAARLVAEASKESPANLDVALELLDLEGRLAAARNEHERALAVYGRMAALADLGALPRSGVRAAVGKAEAHIALGDTARAMEAFAAAGNLISGAARLVPLGKGRDSFFDLFGEAARAQVEFLLTRDVRAAARAARVARARSLDSLRWRECLGRMDEDKRHSWEIALAKAIAQRDAMEQAALSDWQRPTVELERERTRRRQKSAELMEAWDAAVAALPCSGGETLSEPLEGEVFLVAQRLRRGAALLAVGRSDAVAAVISEIDGDHAQTGIEALGHLLTGARRLRIIAEGPLERIEWHALRIDGKALGAMLPIVYGLDLPAAAPRAPRRDGALIVADPRNDLAAVRRQADEVERSLRARGFDSILRFDGDEATHARVRAALAAGAAVFHYAGHGAYAGTDGAESQLFLAEGTTLSIQDLLTLRAAPPTVLLVACEGARSSGTAAASLGLSQAFLLAGAESVLAASRPVRSDEAAALMTALYEGMPRDGEIDLAALLRAALAKRGRGDLGDWAAFRVVVR